ncbi:MAG: helix-turn-helix domain-containing protein [Pseudomonadota bacterium]|jgi:hypothetical protein|nr:helix-turn-helix domain-containing protein [Pseudomonadota bacterium]MEC9236926.1 helix-turn-helix domain-containing protein [Pseudomonadota bacterium]
MQKQIAIHTNNAAHYAFIKDAISTVHSDLDFSSNDGFGDINIFIAPFDEDLPQKSLREKPLAYVLYIGAQPREALSFDYKFLTPLRLGRIIDRITALLEGRATGQLPRRLDIMGWQICLPENMLRAADGQTETELTDTEVHILRYLYVAKGTPVPRQELLDNVWGYHKDVETHTIETHIYRLRQKLEQDPAEPEVLITQADGYVLKMAPIQAA